MVEAQKPDETKTEPLKTRKEAENGGDGIWRSWMKRWKVYADLVRLQDECAKKSAEYCKDGERANPGNADYLISERRSVVAPRMTVP